MMMNDNILIIIFICIFHAVFSFRIFYFLYRYRNREMANKTILQRYISLCRVGIAVRTTLNNILVMISSSTRHNYTFSSANKYKSHRSTSKKRLIANRWKMSSRKPPDAELNRLFPRSCWSDSDDR